MKKLEEILRDKPIKNKLSFAFRIMDILYVVLALVAVVELIRSKGYIGSIVVVVLLVLAIIFNASMSKMLAKMLIDPITNLVTASEKIASGDFEIGVPYESEDELGRLSDSFETAAAILKKVVSDLQTIVEQFSDGNFDVHSSCPEAYVGQLRDVLDELDEMVNKVSETMHGIQDSSEQVSAGSNQLAVSAQDIAEFYFVTVYVPNAQQELKRLDYRMQWEVDFLAYLKKLEEKKPVIYAGDLNVAHQEIDLKNPKTNRGNAGFTDEERACFSKVLENGFIDTFRYFYPEQTGIYSWWSYRFQARAKNAGWRIDYFVVSQCLQDRLADAKIHTEITGSDHCPIELDIQ